MSYDFVEACPGCGVNVPEPEDHDCPELLRQAILRHEAEEADDFPRICRHGIRETPEVRCTACLRDEAAPR